VDLAGQLLDGSSELGVGVQLVLLDQEVVVGLLLPTPAGTSAR
jgi:hypothetical protein